MLHDLLFLIETHDTAEINRTLKNSFVDFDVFTKGRKMKKQRKQYHGRGGVACIARKGFVSAGIETECDDLLCNIICGKE